MRFKTTVSLVLSLVVHPLCADEKPSLSDETDRISYAIGHQIGNDFRKQHVDLDRQALSQGMGDGHQGNPPLLPAKEMNRRLVELKRRITDETKAKALERLEKHQAEMKHKHQLGREFLASNGKKPGILTTQSGMQYRVITPGAGTPPQLTDRVRINYKSSRLDGKVINSSEHKGGPEVFPVTGMIPGATEAIRLMRPGAKWELYLPSKLAYGRRGPYAHEAIIAELELLEILPSESAQTEQSSGDSAD
ncbi:MAG: FKBP-type peptidyl-prolyl cis-trans isomerase N-terminal domain-containing protein [Candidatus Thiodiazotropha sp.]